MSKVIVKDTYGTKYALLESVMLELGRGFRGRVVVREHLSTAWRCNYDQLRFYLGRAAQEIKLTYYGNKGRMSIGCRDFYQYEAIKIRKWAQQR